LGGFFFLDESRGVPLKTVEKRMVMEDGKRKREK